jgi:hypothetical protein
MDPATTPELFSQMLFGSTLEFWLKWTPSFDNAIVPELQLTCKKLRKFFLEHLHYKTLNNSFMLK